MDWITYLLQASLIFLVFYGFYWFALRQETHYQLNRTLLLGIMWAALFLPILPFPHQLTVVQEEIIPVETISRVIETDFQESLDFETNVIQHETQTVHINWLQLLLIVYLTGAGLMALRLMFRMASILFLLSRSQVSYLGDFMIAESDEDFQPFSFFHIIFWGNPHHTEETRDQILQHELIHAQQWHSLDIIIAEIFSVLLWFHPLAKSLKRSIRLNLEYIVDSEMLDTGTDRKTYQYSLLQVVTRQPVWYLSNNFNHSFIKKRIIMMNSKKSPELAKLKHLLFIPILFCTYALINTAQAQTQEQQIENHARLEAERKAAEAEKRMMEAQIALEKAQKQYEKALKLQEELTSEELEARAEEMEREAREMEEEAEEMEEEIVEMEREARLLEREARLLEEDRRRLEEEHAANLKEDNIYVVIRSDLNKDDLLMIQKNVRKYGIYFRYTEMEFNSDGELTRIGLAVKTESGFSGNAFSYNNGGPIEEPLVFYRIPKEKEPYGIYAGTEHSKIPADVKKSMKKMTGFFSGTFH